MRYSVSVLLFAASTLNAQSHPGTSPVKPPWAWSSEERIQARFDPPSIVARKTRAAPTTKMAADAYIIDGKDDPALFFAWELVDALLPYMEMPPSRAAQARRMFTKDIEAQGWNTQDFWRAVDESTMTYRSTRRQQIDHRMALVSSRKKDRVRINGGIDNYLVKEVCEERQRSLEKLRQTFGREAFDKFLYTAIAPSVTLMISMERDANMLTRIERGCR